MNKVWKIIAIVLISIFIFVVVFLSPIITAWGVVTGRLDIETLAPPSPTYKSLEEQMIW